MKRGVSFWLYDKVLRRSQSKVLNDEEKNLTAEDEEDENYKAWQRRQKVKYRDYFAEPRLRKDWYEASAGLMSDDAGSTSQEHYWNALFAFALCNAGNLLVVERYGSGLLVFETFFRCWEASALYGTRFNDDDLWHRCWWGIFGFGVLMMLGSCMVSLETSYYFWVFPMSTACSHLVLAYANARVAYYLEDCRKFGEWAACQHTFHALLYFYLCLHPTWFLFAIAAYFGIVMNWLTPLLPQSFHLPLSVEYHEDKYKGFSLMVLSQFVALMAMAIQPRVASGDFDIGFIFVTLAGLIFILCYKAVLLDSRIVPIHLHALNGHRKWMRLAWLFAQRLVTGAVILGGAGYQLIVTTTGNNDARIRAQYQRAIRVAALGCCILLILVPVHRDLDLVRPRRPRAPCLLAALGIALIPYLNLPPPAATALFPVIGIVLVYVEARRQRIEKAARQLSHPGFLTRDASSLEATMNGNGYGTSDKNDANLLDEPAPLPEPQAILEYAEKMSAQAAAAEPPKRVSTPPPRSKADSAGTELPDSPATAIDRLLADNFPSQDQTKQEDNDAAIPKDQKDEATPSTFSQTAHDLLDFATETLNVSGHKSDDSPDNITSEHTDENPSSTMEEAENQSQSEPSDAKNNSTFSIPTPHGLLDLASESFNNVSGDNTEQLEAVPESTDKNDALASETGTQEDSHSQDQDKDEKPPSNFSIPTPHGLLNLASESFNNISGHNAEQSEEVPESTEQNDALASETGTQEETEKSSQNQDKDEKPSSTFSIPSPHGLLDLASESFNVSGHSTMLDGVLESTEDGSLSSKAAADEHVQVTNEDDKHRESKSNDEKV